MATTYASGKNSIADCDRCSFRYKRSQLRPLVIKTKLTNVQVCPVCWEEDQPQLQLGMFPINDPQAIRNPRPDNSYWQSGMTGLQIDTINPANPSSVLSFGTPGEGSRVIAWGWNPVGLNNPLGLTGLVNALKAQSAVGTVTVTTQEN